MFSKAHRCSCGYKALEFRLPVFLRDAMELISEKVPALRRR
jgi:hypothetical protein